MEYKDYYKILGVPKTATAKDIKAAYRKLARKYHPDVNKGDAKAEARFKEINEANEVLSDPDKRQRYDTLGSDWASYRPPPGTGRPGSAGGGRVVFEDDDLGGFSEFFRTIFGGGGGGFGGARASGGPAGGPGGGGFEDIFGRARQQRPARGADVEGTVDLTLEDVLRGTTRTVSIDDESGTPRKIEVKIPPGVADGTRVRAAGEGAGSSGSRGDLYLRVRVLPHPTFERAAADLKATVTVPLTTAVLGGETMVPTLDGPIGIKIPPGSRPGRVFRLRGHGLPRLEGGGRGDLLAALGVELPDELAPRERELFEELKRLGH
jgi:DnaJ-class molecular chaperone